MKMMEEKILSEGVILPGKRIEVGGFLNERIDAWMLREIGEEIARLYDDAGATMILTIESSGIAVAVAAGMAMGLPVVIAKRSKTAKDPVKYYSALVYSFTHGKESHVTVRKEYIPAGERVLVVDDFLTHGSALNGLIAIAEDAGAEVVGCAAAVEKGFQMGGDNLRARGYRVESLAIIDEMTDTDITFR